MSEAGNGGAQTISGAVTIWLEDVGRLLRMVEAVVQHVQPSEDTPASVAAVLRDLPALVRECRSQVPTEDMVRAWVRAAIEKDGPALALAG